MIEKGLILYNGLRGLPLEFTKRRVDFWQQFTHDHSIQAKSCNLSVRISVDV